jgi:hypothetical protein
MAKPRLWFRENRRKRLRMASLVQAFRLSLLTPALVREILCPWRHRAESGTARRRYRSPDWALH